MNKFPYIPEELVNIIADYHDYDKYCKPEHQLKFKDVMRDIINMSEVMNPISAKLVKECWGPYSQILYNEYMWQDDTWLSIQPNTFNEWMDYYDEDEDNNYGMVGLVDDNQ
tara:strand:- start:232 stop:564 length:333 start_codon:yes stop_codon:yes gene_type:complete